MISTHQFISIDKDTSERLLESGKVRDMLNLIPLSNGTSNSGERQNLKGNTAATQVGMSDDNYVCKGVVVDEETSLIYLFCTAETTVSEVTYTGCKVLEYNIENNTLTEILSDLFGAVIFDVNTTFIKGFVESGWVYYNDGYNFKHFGITEAKSGDYNSAISNILNEKNFLVYLDSPKIAPTATKSYVSYVVNNTVTKDSWQFRIRYKYKNGSKSSLSPYSDVILAEKNPFKDSPLNRITITIGAQGTESSKFIDKVEVYGVKNNDGVHRFIEDFDFGIDGQGSIDFTNANNTKVLAESESLKPFENIPRSPISVAYAENRAVLAKGLSEYDLSGSYDLNLSIVYETGNGNSLYVKEGGTYEAGLVFVDDKGRRSPVVRRKRISVPARNVLGSYVGFGSIYSDRPVIQATLIGTAPTWATKAIVVLTNEQSIANYIQVPVNLLYYIAPESASPNMGEGEDAKFPSLDGNIYATKQSEMTSRLNAGDNTYNSGLDQFQGYTAIDLQLPVNIPTMPEIGWKVRPMVQANANATQLGGNLYVSDVFTNTVRIEGYTIENWASIPNIFMVEFYKPNTSQFESFYDTPASTEITAGAFNTTVLTTGFDTCYIDLTSNEFKFQFQEVNNNPENSLYNNYLKEQGCVIESPSPSVSESELVDIRNENLVDKDGFNVSEGKRTLTLDYNKKISNQGVLNVENPEYSEKNYRNVLIASNSYVENTKINGLNRFDFEDEFSLPNERTPITHLEVVNNVLLALHERNTTSVYIGEKFLKQSSGEDTVTTTDSFFGDERLLIGGYGTINPESVKTHLGQCFWWDANRGSVVRYSTNGLDAISDEGLKDHFRDKAEKYSDGYKVFGGIDPFLDLYLLSFPSQDGVAAETWAFNIKKGNWFRFSFEFEFATHLGNSFSTFKSGNLWKHHMNSSYNNFYDTQYDSRVTIVVNADAVLDKSFESISIDADSAWDVLSITNEQGQETDLLESEFRLYDNQLYASIKRDKNTPSDLLEGQPALLAGHPIVSKTVKIELRKSGATLQRINVVHVGYSPMVGHLLQAQ